jgi:hypothetical protein
MIHLVRDRGRQSSSKVSRAFIITIDKIRDIVVIVIVFVHGDIQRPDNALSRKLSQFSRYAINVGSWTARKAKRLEPKRELREILRD